MSRTNRNARQDRWCPFHARVSTPVKRTFTRQIKRALRHLVRVGRDVLPPYHPEWKTRNHQS